jgi:hypothetical protein
MKWINGNRSELPEIDYDDFPKQYLVRVKGDDPRSGWVWCGYLTAEKMREVKEDYWEYLDESTPEEGYWKKRCEAAEKFIEKSPCDPDTTSAQLEAYKKWQALKSNPPEYNQDEEWDKAEDIFDTYTRPSEGGYGADYTDKWGFFNAMKQSYSITPK